LGWAASSSVPLKEMIFSCDFSMLVVEYSLLLKGDHYRKEREIKADSDAT
jgi:hypothetical protein